MEPLLEWPINLMKPLLTRQQKDWQTYSKVWIDVQMSTEKTVSICYFQSLNCLLYMYLELYTLFRSLHVLVHVCKFCIIFKCFFIRSCCATWAGLTENSIQRQELVRI